MTISGPWSSNGARLPFQLAPLKTTSRERRGGRRQKGSLKTSHPALGSLSPSLPLSLLPSVFLRWGGRGGVMGRGGVPPPIATPTPPPSQLPSSARLLSPSSTAVSAPGALDKASINCRPVWNTRGTMEPTECPAPRQGWKQVVQESGRIDSSWLMSLNTFTYLRAHSLRALFFFGGDKKKGRERRVRGVCVCGGG